MRTVELPDDYEAVIRPTKMTNQTQMLLALNAEQDFLKHRIETLERKIKKLEKEVKS